MDGNLRATFAKNLPAFHWQAVETGGVGQGVPDLNYCHGGAEGWIECKATSAYAVVFQPMQIGWIERRLRAGGRVFVAVRRKRERGLRAAACDELWLYHGSLARSVETLGLRAPGADVWPLGPAKWNWPAIAERLAGKSGAPIPTISKA